MVKRSRTTTRQRLTVTVDDCRVRIQTGEATVFVDARQPDDWTASNVQIAGAIRLTPEQQPPVQLADHKHNYLVVYCG